MKIFIDNGHGRNTAGKRSPDGQFLEYYYNRIVARRVTAKPQALGLDAELLVPEVSIGNTAADRLADCIAKAAAVHLSSMKLRGDRNAAG